MSTETGAAEETRDELIARIQAKMDAAGGVDCYDAEYVADKIIEGRRSAAFRASWPERRRALDEKYGFGDRRTV